MTSQRRSVPTTSDATPLSSLRSLRRARTPRRGAGGHDGAALAAGDRDVVRLVVDALDAKYAASYTLKAARRRRAAADVRLCRARLVETLSWMSFVGRFLPSDTTTIAKRGNAFRFDMNVVGISSVQSVNERATFLFPGSKCLAPLSLTRRLREDVLQRPRRADGPAAPRYEAARPRRGAAVGLHQDARLVSARLARADRRAARAAWLHVRRVPPRRCPLGQQEALARRPAERGGVLR